MQMLIEGSLVDILSSLQLAERYAPTERGAQVATCCTRPLELPLLVSEHYRKVYPERVQSRMAQKNRETEFFRDHCKIRITKQLRNTVGGFVVLGDELLCLHNQERGKGLWMLDHAVNLGARKLTCFAVPHLLRLYESRGFDGLQSEPNWEPGGLPVITMRLRS